MHNVKKTPRTELERAMLERSRAEALKEYVSQRDLIFDKKSKHQYDEELMDATYQVLKRHPDIYTFWNLRRDTIRKLEERKDDETDDDYKKRLADLYDAEIALTWLSITEANPKSYTSWYQRGWAIERHPSFNYAKELEKCEKALSVDHRNFHCWDHRRVVAKLAQLSEENELAFSDRLLKNPSNYSAWHYRGTLLQRLSNQLDGGGDAQTSEQQKHRIDADRLVKELEQIKNVCCYTAEDQSGWTYCRWLCEAACIPDESEPITIVSFHVINNSIFLVMNEAVNQNQLAVLLGPRCAEFNFEPVSQFNLPNHKFCRVHSWLITASSLSDVTIQTNDGEISVSSQSSYVNKKFIQKVYSNESVCKNETMRQALTNIVEMCRGLLEMEEKEIPWPNYALARTLILLNGYVDSKIVDESLELLRRVATLDPQRRGVYESAAEHLQIHQILNEKKDGQTNSQLDCLLNEENGHLDFGSLEIQSFDSLKFLAGLITSMTFKKSPNFDSNQLKVFQRLQT
ncbi:hypothetical protein M3Y94_00946500 [Aphelenchoides besseyi]|nr:hypothetical protein M3Y94_00946500 [Aphelenchoides besseyi]KAI6224852.1 Geranylgeranyl transferase type-2 subunit alpha [Aphelenchoides besseyi]